MNVGLALRDLPVSERLAARLVRTPSGCLIWTGRRLPKGYGQITVNGRNQLVHRLMYALYVGPIPDGYEIDHLCRVTSCAEPADLEAVTPEENRRRQTEAHTECRRGHLIVVGNIGSDGPGNSCRRCLTCRRDDQRARRARTFTTSTLAAVAA